LWSKRIARPNSVSENTIPGRERQRQKDERRANQPEQQPLEREKRRQVRERPGEQRFGVAARGAQTMQAPLDDCHQRRVQDREREETVRAHPEQQVQLEFERGGRAGARQSGKQRRQRRDDGRERKQQRLESVEPDEQALDPVERNREPQRDRQRLRKAEAQLRREQNIVCEKRAVQRECGGERDAFPSRQSCGASWEAERQRVFQKCHASPAYAADARA
jgi:hypothetical protein